MIKPITPSKAAKKEQVFPDFVIQAFNDLIEDAFNGKSARVSQKSAIELISTYGSVTKKKIFDNKWLDVEDHYRKAGWKVNYDRPAYNESYEPEFLFTKP